MALPLVVAITGATGVVYGLEVLKALQRLAIPRHLIVSEMGIQTLAIESHLSFGDVKALADVTHNVKDLAASVSSGSFRSRGMIVAPCSIKTLSGIANSDSLNLVIRAADVTLKERRPLVLMVRETPLHLGHLRLMTAACEMGAIIMPPLPSFYHKPETIDDIVQQSVGRALDQLGIDHDLTERWAGI
ncbi:MAG: UbiX family flavin prenyltransferase [Rhodospirillales bacterium]|nr:UbiX family flavin prenyltransferase [Rhodospirillales bacterium]